MYNILHIIYIVYILCYIYVKTFSADVQLCLCVIVDTFYVVFYMVRSLHRFDINPYPANVENMVRS